MALQYDCLELYPTNNCQLHCVGCYLNQNTKKWNVKTTQSIIDSGIFKRVEKEINLLGGEPTQWEYLLDFLCALRATNDKVKITVTTNGVRFIEDDSYFKDFIDCCVTNRVSVNVSYHNDLTIVNVLKTLKKFHLLRNVIFVPTSMVTMKDLEKTFKQLRSLYNCVWRPLILREPSIFAKKITEFLMKQQRNLIESNHRIVDKVKKSNLEIVGEANLTKNYYKSFDCRCGKNGVIYVDGKLYHCLSQAIEGNKPISLKNERIIMWKKCNYDYCCCDTFDLRTRKEES